VTRRGLLGKIVAVTKAMAAADYPVELWVGIIIAIFHTFWWRKIMEHLIPTPYWSLVAGMYVLACLNVLVKVLLFLPIMWAPRARAGGRLPEDVKVSVIVPAYNEADSIGDVCRQLLKSTSAENVEFIIVDDRSSDKTWTVLDDLRRDTKDPRFKPLSGLERGKVHWKGKNWAVWQGYEAACKEFAKGRHYLLFLDADVSLSPGAIESFVESISSSDVDWISFVPKTTFSCFAEYLFNWPRSMIAQALIPNAINRSGKVYAFGQCNLFTREAYEKLGTHREVGHMVAESHALAAAAKEKGVKLRCELAYEQAHLVWYGDFWECWKGQIKSIRGRLSQKIPALGIAIPRWVVALAMNAYLTLNVLPSALWFLQLAKLFLHAMSLSTSEFARTDLHVFIACSISIACSFLTRLIGYLCLGYDMYYWWSAPITGSALTAAMAVRACRPLKSGRWSDDELPEGFVIPREAVKKGS